MSGALDPDQVVAERLERRLGQPVAGLVGGLWPASTSVHAILRFPPYALFTAASNTRTEARQMSGPVPSPSMNGRIGWSGTTSRPWASWYFLLSAGVDLANLSGNVGDGVHVASCGGVWMALVHGFAGLRDVNGHELAFTPRLPPDWDSMRFRLIVRGSRLEIEMRPEVTSFRLLQGEPLSLICDGQSFEVYVDEAVAVPVMLAAH